MTRETLNFGQLLYRDTSNTDIWIDAKAIARDVDG